MGAKLSAQQRGIYFQVVGILVWGGKTFSKGLVRRFVRWLFLHYPHVSLENICSVNFWNTVGGKLTILVNQGDKTASKLIPLFVLIRSSLIEKGGVQGQPGQFTPVSPVSPPPCTSTSAPKLGETCRASRDTQGTSNGSSLPGSPRLPQNPSPGSPGRPGQAARAPTHSPVSLVVNPKFNASQVVNPQLNEVKNPQLISQDPCSPVYPCSPCSPVFPCSSPDSQNGPQRAQHGRDHMVGPLPCASPSQNPFLPPLTNPFFPNSSPSSYPDPSHFPSGNSSSGACHSITTPPNPTSSCCCSSLKPSHSVSPPAPPLLASGSHAPPSGSHAPPSGSHAQKTRSVRPGNQNSELGDTPFVAPESFRGRGGRYHEWEPFSFQTKRELCKAQKEFGRRSKYFKGLLKATFSANETVPSDLKDLFSCLLSSAEFRLWKQGWKRALETMLPELLHSEDTAVDADGNPLTLDHLCGEGNWAKPEEQARGIPRSVLVKIAEAAEKAFNAMPEEEPQASFLSIKQFPSEPFVKFVDRLQVQVERQIERPELQENLLLEVAKNNANEVCRHIILGLPLHPPPTLEMIIEACTRKAPMVRLSQTAPAPAPRKTPAAAAIQRTPLSQLQCFHCGQLGHLARECSASNLCQGNAGNGLGGRIK
ncbi:endogenous retrovirus group K member 113 Gag polyprotein-like [Parus major]|uniref:endogenous retrovirus group K member 113 Gag polyprotein-like n=1 Tax=Parus major TaxID=9157 RepID=UPI0007710DEC|nr:endogenous retrovirus group K member 113 Gag polyprotein-like [Parus major]